ncbi:MAG: HypC/HybG/HupF family hydrogenase formation chaperone [Lachnospiraceae bacterium]|uniref:HypC/HybG/HupF family hydrogenase formation chaperone n=1 Tax=Candidatus Weimeria bifida TaxID=2599074 RepID=A0A6N7IYG9_9FIRM|nr:HypC/HybG/HupF family hydrogenase formation chaperone [Candidatus Weimeria bifida]RRF95038.1 MAG: HypC/HybG/HupF family hydrogenase formation chaperone [Lachnospiraceae bacterium]
MCVALPGKVIAVRSHDRKAVVDFNGNRVDARTGFVDINPGDYVLVHAGCILQKLTEQDADEMNDIFSEIGSEAGA